MSNRVHDKVAIITGGAGGIGSATGQLLCEQGARVVLVDVNPQALEEAQERIRAAVAGAQVLAIAGDISGEPEAQRAVAEAAAHFDRIDILVNNAGMREYVRLADATAQSWDRILGVNLLSYAHMAKAAIPHLRKAGRGAIVNVSSTYGVTGRVGMGQYDATKAAILALTRTLAFEEAEHGIRANAVCPGSTLTPFHVKRLQQSEEAILEDKLQDCLMHRWCNPREIAWPILFLASDEASYITATTLMADGGRPVM